MILSEILSNHLNQQLRQRRQVVASQMPRRLVKLVVMRHWLFNMMIPPFSNYSENRSLATYLGRGDGCCGRFW